MTTGVFNCFLERGLTRHQQFPLLHFPGTGDMAVSKLFQVARGHRQIRPPTVLLISRLRRDAVGGKLRLYGMAEPVWGFGGLSGPHV